MYSIRKLSFLVCIILLFCLIVSCSSYSSTKGKVEDFIDKAANIYSFNGSILVADKSGILFRRGYGMADYAKKVPNTPDTMFRLGSITKQFTAMSVLILQERGLLDVNNTLDMYIKDYPNGNQITIHNLLTHTSGIAEYTSGESVSEADHYYSPEAIISLFKNEPVYSKPGEEFRYCNSNYILLGYIIEKVSGQKYEDFLKDNIFEPLGMSSSGYDHNGKDGRVEAMGYQEILNEEAAYLDMSFPYAAGGLVSSVNDLYKWDKALYTEKLVSKSSIEKVFTPFLGEYAYGWSARKISLGGKECLVAEHGGQVNGFSAHILRNMDQKSVVIILSNKENNSFGNIAKEIANYIAS